MKLPGTDMWDERYSSDEFAYGTEPAEFLREQATHLAPASRVLVPADGEGRNSVFLAGLGHSVLALDASDHGLAKARTLAERKGVTLEHVKADVHSYAWPDAEFDAAIGIFIQFSPPAERSKVFAGMRKAVRPGGLVFIHGYHEDQLAHGTGGPPILEHLYTDDLLRDAFAGWEIVRLETYERVLSEGKFHQGMSALVDLVVRRPSL